MKANKLLLKEAIQETNRIKKKSAEENITEINKLLRENAKKEQQLQSQNDEDKVNCQAFESALEEYREVVENYNHGNKKR